MTDWRLEKPTLASKCEFFWTTNSDLYGDVTFLVGPKKEKIKGFKILLMATSPVFEAMLGATWTKARGQHGPIKLPHTDPVIFRHFLRLLLTDITTTQAITGLKLSMNQVLELFFLSKEYLIPGLQKTLQEYIENHLQVDTVLNIYEQIHDKDEEELEELALDMIVVNAAKVLGQDDFLKISKPVLFKILSSENLRGVDELFLFNAAHRWAKFQSRWDENMRDDDDDDDDDNNNHNNSKFAQQLLRECLPEIRLPLITSREWSLHVEPTRILTEKESIELLKYLPLKAEEKEPRYGPILQLSENLSLKTEARHPAFSRLVLSHQIDDVEYVYTGERQCIGIRASKNIRIRGMVFCGPFLGDSEYEVTVSIGDCYIESAEEKKVIFAREKSTFYFPLTTPILLEDHAWYKVFYKLKGANTGQIPRSNASTVEQDGITFVSVNTCNNQCLEIQYSTE